MNKVIISGGGTGGHVFPAIAIADALKKRQPDIDILFVGAHGKMEMERVPKAGYKIIGLNIAGLQRKMTFKNMLLPIKLVNSLAQAWRIIKDFNPDAVIGVGGYASAPILKIAQYMNKTYVIQEQNSFAGLTNKISARHASKIFVAYDHMDKFFPKNKIVFSGNPVRQDLLTSVKGRTFALESLGLDTSKKTILILGGSLGARQINNAILSQSNTIKQLKDINLIWQVGRVYYEECIASELASLDHVKIMAFIEDINIVYEAADIVVARAGALTISELACLGKAAILIPSPNVSEDHQTVNAMSLVTKDAAILVRDKDAITELVPKMIELVNDKNKITSLSTNIKYFGRPDAAAIIADSILELCKNKER